MNIDTFWSIIEATRQPYTGNIKEQIELVEKLHQLLIDTLVNLSPKEIQEFDRILWLLMAQSYRSDLWEAAWLVQCGCGDDAFYDFRNWLISQGKYTYEKTLADPEHLADIVDKKNRLDAFFGWITDVGQLAYEQKTGQPIPETGYRENLVLVGEDVTSEEKLPAKYPRIIAKIGGCDDESIFE
jgi:hypothetical protein